MLSNLVFAFRQLRKSPGFTFVAIATLAGGIGACTAMFSIVNAVLLKPLPFREPERLVWIENQKAQDLSSRTSRVATLLGWRENTRSFESVAGYFAFFDYMRYTLTGVGDPERLRGVGVSDNFLPTLGVTPLYGRNFTAEECRFNAAPTIILSNAFWRARFQADPGVVGRTISLNNKPATVVGVLPASFDFSSIFSPGTEVGIIVPFPLTNEMDQWGNTLFGIGRLKPGVTLAQAQDDLSAASRLVEAKYPNSGTIGASATTLDSSLRGKFRKPFLMLVGAVACILMIACVNLSNLLLSRLNARRQEFAVRIAVGARPRHLMAQTLTESLLLAVGGSLVGIPMAAWTTDILSRLQTFGVPLLGGATVDPMSLAVTVGLTLLAGVACGILPALHLAADANNTAQGANQQRSAGRSASTLRDSLIVAEIALACVLLIGAGLLLRSFDTLLKVNLGFQPEHAMAWRIDPPRPFNTRAEASQYLADAVQRVAALPGVEAAGISDTLPLGRNRTWAASEVGVQYPAGGSPGALPRIIDKGYLQAMKIPLIEGRYFDSRDSIEGTQTVIINQSLAKVLTPRGGSALGKKLALSQNGSTVVGVVGDVRHSTLEAPSDNEMYLNVDQSSDWSATELVVRSSLPMAALAPEIRATLAKFDPAMPTGEYYELEKLVDDAVAPRRLITRLLGVFSVMALTLAALGLYGVISYSTGQRSQEIGIRMAVGAQRRDILRLILSGGFRLIALGIVIGVAASLALSRLVEQMLYGITAHDPLIFAANAAIIAVVGLAACIVPAVRATALEPSLVLRGN
jgi:putative ABC transport system permease protein